MRNIEKLKLKYRENFSDHTTKGKYIEHINYHFNFGDYTVSVVQEHNYKGNYDLEYAIISNRSGNFIYLEQEGDAVARYKTYDEVDQVIQHFRNQWLSKTNQQDKKELGLADKMFNEMGFKMVEKSSDVVDGFKIKYQDEFQQSISFIEINKRVDLSFQSIDTHLWFVIGEKMKELGWI